jgi:hypothetical protein
LLQGRRNKPENPLQVIVLSFRHLRPKRFSGLFLIPPSNDETGMDGMDAETAISGGEGKFVANKNKNPWIL